MNQELREFVRDSLVEQVSKKEIDAALKKAGYDEDERKEALSAFADVDFPVPVPVRKPYLSAREAFLYLVMFATLYITAWNVGSLLFEFINKWLPDAVNSYDYMYTYSAQSIRMSTAALIVSFPIFLWMSYILRAAMQKFPERRASKIRKWLTYITLFISAGVIIGDLISVLYSFLNGELTLRFGLKSIVVGGIAALMFGYYLWDLRGEEK